MVARRRNSLVAVCISAAVVFGMVIVLASSMSAFVAPRGAGASSTQTGSATSTAELKQPVRQLRTSVESGPPQGPQKINLLFIGTLAGTAVIGLVALFAYGAYTGSGSGL
mmetsp:Transcript_22987/g.44063  ORF Transcript_22987/g.44063 Transcript_22987/m.44063 type:complete len:110 (-) Transcript_22987:152-481(-)